MRTIAKARVDHASTCGDLFLVRDGEGFSIREWLTYKPMGHKRCRVLTLYAGRDRRLTDKTEALARFDREVQAMGASYV